MNRANCCWVVMAITVTIGPMVVAGADEINLTVQESEQYGAYIADAEGRALYVFSADTRGDAETTAKSECYDVCAAGWPALEVNPATGEAGVRDGSSAGAGSATNVNESFIGTFQREDGSTQVTYNGRPLYYHTVGMEPGKITSQAVEVFDGKWTLIAPDGNPIDIEAEAKNDG